jgi:exonuclease SbcC
VRLLGLGLFDMVREQAAQRAMAADRQRAVAEGQLGELAAATPEAEKAAKQRVAQLRKVADTIAEAAPELQALAKAVEVAEAAAVVTEKAIATLERIAVPDGVTELAAELAAATAARVDAEAGEDDATRVWSEAEKALGALPARAGLEALVHARADHDKELERVPKGEAFVAKAAAEHEAAAGALGDAEAALRALETASVAHTLAVGLVVGEPCPVCRATVTELHASPVANEALRDANAAVSSARKALEDAASARAKGEATLATVRERVAELAARLADAPADLDAQLARLAEAEAAVAAARKAADEATRARKAADARLAAATQADSRARQQFDAARDQVAALGPPAPARDDLAADWAELAAWVAERRPVLEVERREHRKAASEAQGARDERVDRLASMARRIGVELPDVPNALARAEADLAQIQKHLERAAELRLALLTATESHDVARSVADHLKADRFERWLLDEALQLLVEGATARLQQLAGGAYSLELDKKTRAFAVVDHINAGQVRPARTLSGGETFLTSLALALALADQVAALAAGSAARLETVLLDEGFGTLDPDALDLVATALEELGAQGRMVGIVTHVQELAERLPVRYRVAKVGGAATITKELS